MSRFASEHLDGQQVHGQPVRDVIFVDDDASALDGLRRNLGLMGTDWEAKYVKGGIHVLRRLEMGPAVVVSDLRMPRVGGMELLEGIRTVERKVGEPRCYFILITGEGTDIEAAEALRAGADDVVFKPANARLLAARVDVGLRALNAELRSHRLTERLHTLSLSDPLTGTWNRRAVEQALKAELSRVRRGHQNLSVLLLDVDRFKAINDNHGHNVGDAVLREVAQRTDRSCRDYDRMGRWGGEEFLLLCPHTNSDEACVVAQRVVDRVSSHPINVAGELFNVTATVGVSTALSGVDISADDLVSQADLALYRGKREGRNRVARFAQDEQTGSLADEA